MSLVKRPTVFLSHNRKDKWFVRRLANDLKLAGANVWIDEAEIRVGDSLIEKIRAGIDEGDYLAVIVSSNSVASEWVKRELDIAMNQEIEQKRVKVLPLLLEPCDLPGFLKGKLYADFTKLDQYAESLGQVLKRLDLVRPAPSRVFAPGLIQEALVHLGSTRVDVGAGEYEMLSQQEPREVGEWLVSKLTPLPESHFRTERLAALKLIARIIHEINDLSFETGDWLLGMLTPTDPHFWDGWSEDGSFLKEVLGWIIGKMGQLSDQGIKIRDSLIQQALSSFPYDWEFNDWVVYREYAIYTSLKSIGDPVSAEAIRECWPSGRFQNRGDMLGGLPTNTTCLLRVLHGADTVEDQRYSALNWRQR